MIPWKGDHQENKAKKYMEEGKDSVWQNNFSDKVSAEAENTIKANIQDALPTLPPT